jgi:hypothetical protein
VRIHRVDFRFFISYYFFSFYRLLENEKFLIVLSNQDKFFVFLERLPVLDMAIQRGKSIKSLNRDKLGQGVLFSFDEAKRVLAVCASTKVLWLYSLIRSNF